MASASDVASAAASAVGSAAALVASGSADAVAAGAVSAGAAGAGGPALAGAAGAGAAAAAGASSVEVAISAASGVFGVSRTWAVPPAAWIFSMALLLNASATTNSGALDVAVAEDLQRPRQRAHQACGAQDLLVDRDRRRLGTARGRAGHVTGFELAVLDEAVDRAEVHDLVHDLEAVAEAAQLRDPDVERGLATLEPGRDRAAGPGLLALGAAARGLALAGRDPPPHPRLGRVGTGVGPQIMQLHSVSLAGAFARAGVEPFAAVRRGAVPEAGSAGVVRFLRDLAGASGASISSTVTRKRTARTMPAGRVVGRHLDGVADPVETEGADRRSIAGDVADRALDLGHAEPSGHVRPPVGCPAAARSGPAAAGRRPTDRGCTSGPGRRGGR